MAVYRVSVSVMYLDPNRSVHRAHGKRGRGKRRIQVDPHVFGGFWMCHFSMVKNRGCCFFWGGGKVLHDMFMWKENKKHVSNDGFWGIKDFSPLNGLLNQVERFQI